MTSLDSYRELIISLKNIGVSGVSPKDKQVLLDLLKTLNYICEFKILKQCYDRDTTIKNIIPNIDSKLKKLGATIDGLQSELLERGELTDFEKIKLKATTVSYNRYSEIKDAIESRNFDHYVNFMNNNLNSAQQIMAVCSSVLDQADVDYAKTFVINGNEKTAVDVIYDLKQMPTLSQELTRYFNRKKHYIVENEEKIRDDQEYLRYLELIKNNETLFRRFMDSIIVIGTTDNDKEIIVRERLSRNKLKLADLNKSVLTSLKNIKLISSLESSIEKDEAELEKIERVKESFGMILSQMNDAGLMPIANQYVSTSANIDASVEQRVVDYVKVSMRVKSFDIKDVKTKIEEEVRLLESQRVRQKELLNGSYESLSSYGKELVHKYPDETEHLLDIVNDKVKGEVTPLFAAYALKALMDSKSISPANLTQITNNAKSGGLEALVDSYNAIVKNTAITLENAVNAVSQRAIFDQSEFGELRIK